jgi:hypothetical protein
MFEVKRLLSSLTKLLTFQQKMRILGDVPHRVCALNLVALHTAALASRTAGIYSNDYKVDIVH